jgi:hypothetical protein
VGDAPAAEALAIHAEARQRVEPTAHLRAVAGETGVPQRADAVELPLPDERLGVDREPRLALGPEDVPGVEVLVDEAPRVAVDAPVEVERRVQERSLERPASLLPSSRDLVGPPLSRFGERSEGVRVSRRVRQSLEEPRQDGNLVDARLGQRHTRHAPFEEQGLPLVVPREESHGAVPTPCGQGVRLVDGLEVRRGIELEDGVARGHDERAGRVERLLQLEPPPGGALGRELRKPLEPFVLGGPFLAECRWDAHVAVGWPSRDALGRLRSRQGCLVGNERVPADARRPARDGAGDRDVDARGRRESAHARVHVVAPRGRRRRRAARHGPGRGRLRRQWGWRIALAVDGDGLALRMDNVVPASVTGEGDAGPYPVMVCELRRPA